MIIAALDTKDIYNRILKDLEEFITLEEQVNLGLLINYNLDNPKYLDT